MGLIKLELSQQFLIDALKLNNDFEIKEIKTNMTNGTFPVINVILKHNDIENDNIKNATIHYDKKIDDKGNDITKIKKIVIEGKEQKFDGIDYFVEEIEEAETVKKEG